MVQSKVARHKITKGDIKLKMYQIYNQLMKETISVGLYFIAIAVLFSLSLSYGMSMAYADTIEKETSLEKDWEKDGGIRVLSIRQTSAGYMLDFRYKVINPKKAAVFIDRSNKPLLHVLKNGSILASTCKRKNRPSSSVSTVCEGWEELFYVLCKSRTYG